ncbi:hypothetical protein D0T12_08605 [Actinomadura spongiicola]|uniref:HTH luxR-type domain-containing protein n=1 Tax=Actinomadura spongiicola TaxID=2303421 RepID=A0A372GNE8_9ACTN|nr:LuxR family transcriptional regulator [Actinomadura spongiicola]RFS86609.1 hypothetical protein D0T12_08605 [Actinomadura spongiicola]
MTAPAIRRNLEQLSVSFANSMIGEPQVVIVSGPVGSGKSELLGAFRRGAADADVTFLAASALVLETDQALGVIRALLEGAAAGGAARGRGDAGRNGRGDGDRDADDRGVRRSLARALDDLGSVASFAGLEPAAAQRVTLRAKESVRAALLDLAAGGGLVICIDDIQYADSASLEVLLHFVRRAQNTRVLMVLGARDGLHPRHPLLYQELIGGSSSQQIRLGALSRDVVAQILEDELGPYIPSRLVADCHAVSGGNAALVRALVDDLRASGAPFGERNSPSRLVVGEAFSQAYLSLLYRSDPAMLRAGQGLAVLGEDATPLLIGQLLDVPPAEVVEALAALNSAGLLEDGRFRHPAARSAVLGNLAPDTRSRLHHDAAFLLHDAGAGASSVVEHLIACGDISAPWAVSCLVEAAEQELVAGRVARTVAYLKAAQLMEADERQSGQIKEMLIRAAWRVDPVMALPFLDQVVSTLHGGPMPPRPAFEALKLLLWNGRSDEARAMLERILVDSGRTPAEFNMGLPVGLTSGLLCAYPALLQDEPARSLLLGGELAAQESLPADQDPLTIVLAAGRDAEAVASAEQVLGRSRLDDSTLGALAGALTAMIYAGQPGKAATWAELLLERAGERQAPVWGAIFSAVLAECLLRTGDLRQAARSAETALSSMPAQAWGILVGAPLATAALARTLMGDYEGAARHLEVPVPDAMFGGIPGLHYLLARGRYNLAIDRPYAALADFETCGNLMGQWRLDVPGLVAWRVEAARAMFALRRPEPARGLLDEQLKLLRPEQHRPRGAALRLKAATERGEERPRVLWDAVKSTQESGDPVEEAFAFADLARAYQALGDADRARTAVRRARSIAIACHIEPLRHSLTGSRDAPGEGLPAVTNPPRHMAELSDAERRVTVLAVQGFMNREIAQRLSVTVSTVEQHLTRVYRKLGVSSRSDLATVYGGRE